ncbi:hypothetical protein ACFQE8_17985 [Salinirubellus sp. GCM10025818]|jgi:hypothetical protein|uniref:hypothetical protein n=1 Tax=Salinirubellus TaxID=2162630 RepID=UPI0030CF6F12
MIPDWLRGLVTVVVELVAVVAFLALTLYAPVMFVLWAPALPEPVLDLLGLFPYWAVVLAVTVLSFGVAFGFLVRLANSAPFPEWF